MCKPSFHIVLCCPTNFIRKEHFFHLFGTHASTRFNIYYRLVLLKDDVGLLVAEKRKNGNKGWYV